MKYLLFSFLLIGCSVPHVNYTILLKENHLTLQNLKGEECTESGYQFRKKDNELTTFYKNCDIHMYRQLEEFELEQWKGKK